jgi:hypothetical protein
MQVLLESSNTSSVTTVTLPLLITGRAEVAASDIKVYITGTTAAVPLRDAKVQPQPYIHNTMRNSIVEYAVFECCAKLALQRSALHVALHVRISASAAVVRYGSVVVFSCFF